MAYMTFTDALMQAKRSSQLRGTPFTTADTSNLQSAYMSGAAERAAGGRSAALAEQTLAGQQRNFANTLAQEKMLSEQRLSQTRALSEADLASRAQISNASLLQQKTLSDQTLAQTRQLATDKIASDKAIADAKAISDKALLDAQIAANKIIEDAKNGTASDIAKAKIEADRLIETTRAAAAREAEITRLTQEKYLAGLSSEQARATAEAQIKAQEEAGNKALIGNVVSTVGTLGGGYVMVNGVPTWLGGAVKGTVDAAALGTDLAASEAAYLSGAGAGTAGVTAGAATAGAGGVSFFSGAGAALPYAWIPAAAVIGGSLAEAAGGGYDAETDSGTGLARVGATMQNVVQGFGPTSTEILFGDNYLGSMTETANVVQDIVNPAGFVARLLHCIIVTACTNPNSYEVNVARKYRDAHMDRMELRGYYQISEKIVPLINRFPTFKRFIKRFLVDGIIDYCEYANGDKMTLPRRWSAFVTKAFLGLCGYVGSRRTQFVRSNGEVF